MRIKHTLKTLVIISGLTLLAACKASAPTVDPAVMLNYCKETNDVTTENLSKSYGSMINKSRKTGLKESGIYSDYAVTLVKMGKRAEANSWFNKEMEAFPESKGYVLKLKKELIPEYINNNSISVNEASVDGEEEQALSPATRAAAEERAAEVMQESDSNIEAATATTGTEQPKSKNKPKSKKKSKSK